MSLFSFDTNHDITSIIPWLVARGGARVVRYIGLGNQSNPKYIQLPEALACMAGGILVAPVYEVNGDDTGAAMGDAAGRYSLSKCKSIGIRQGKIIWYTQDRDTQPAEMPGVEKAFAAFKAALGGYYTLGAYASGYCCDMLEGQNLIVKKWLTDSMGFLGSRQAVAKGDFDIRQGLPTSLGPNHLDIDEDFLVSDTDDVLDGIPDLPIPTSVVPGSPAVAWMQVCLAVRAGHSGLSIDGGYGPATRAAVAAFQTQAALPPTGDADGATCAALAALPIIYPPQPVAGAA